MMGLTLHRNFWIPVYTGMVEKIYMDCHVPTSRDSQ